MRTIETTVYQFDELSDEAKEKARDWFREILAEDPGGLDDLYASLKAVFKAAKIELKDWSLGPYNRFNHVRFDMGDAGELKGARAVAWLENHLFGPLRMTHAQFVDAKKDYMGYGTDYRPGKVKPCPLTGVCYDEDFLAGLTGAVKGGAYLKDAFSSLADLCGKLAEAEVDYQNEDDHIEESIRANEYEFLENGKRA